MRFLALTLSLAASAAAKACSSGSVQCCDRMQHTAPIEANILPPGILDLLPINLQGLDVPVGLDC
mgnify:CR=1